MNKRQLPCARWACIAILCILSFNISAEARTIVDMKAYPAIGSYHKHKNTLPLCVEIRNLGSAFKGTLEVSNRQAYRKNAGLIMRQVNLPPQSSKQLFLYVPDFESYAPTVKVELKARRQIIAEASLTLNHIYPKDFLVLVFSKEQAGFEYLTNPRLKAVVGKDAQVSIVYPSTSHLPLNWAGYESANAILLCNYPSLSFTHEQKKALCDWVLSGGMLFVSSSLSPGEFKGSSIEQLLPVKEEGTGETRALPALEAYCKAPLTLTEPLPLCKVKNYGGTVMLTEQGAPLLVKKRFGRGIVYYFACDITRPPFTTWTGTIDFWARIFSDMHTSGKEGARGDDSYPLSNPPEIDPPSFKNLSYFLFFYILIVGPLNYMVLKKKDLMLLTFLTVTVISLVFSLSSFMYGYFTKGSETIFRIISLCEVQKNLPAAPMTSYYSLFSPGLSRYAIEMNNPQAITWEITPPEDKSFTLEWKEGPELRDLTLDMWSMRRFKARQVIPVAGAIECSLNEEGDLLSGSITNGMDLTLSDCMLLYHSRITPAFTLNRGSQRISLRLSQPLNTPYDLGSWFTRTWHLNDDDPAYDSKKEHVSFLLNFSSTYRPARTRDDPVILGWSDQNVSGITLSKHGATVEESTFFIITGRSAGKESTGK
ncbi:MAG: hypothetical protein RDV48_22280 [Candidatus Eremiobacteraeota bacterium]|nr:hypothetical protein [Candidatus Eremiobacteraeota bacterium]